MLDEAKVAVPDADLILFVVDGSEPAGKGDKWIAQNILQTDIPVIIIMNKVDKVKKNDLLTKIFSPIKLYLIKIIQ